ncbi:MAG: glycosyltransferase family 4 protein [Chitinispirillaceae bacterium]|nr:glycosyltransferase family 4 protein [Chitinispirillaceae bacterium]
MRIAIVSFGLNGVSGIPRYAQSMLFELLKKDKENYFLIYANEKPKDIFLNQNSSWKKPFINFSNSLWALFFSAWQIRKDKIDIVLSFEVVSPLFLPKNVKLFSVVYDFVWHLYPDSLSPINKIVLPLLAPLSIKQSDFIFCISKTTQNTLHKLYPKKKDCCNVAYCGLQPAEFSFKKNNLDKKYFLAVSTVEPRKNYIGLLRAFVAFKRKYLWNGKLLIVGKQGWGNIKLIEEAGNAGITGDLIYLKSVDDKKLSELYANATGFVLFPFYEGFGISYIEALSYGLPVASSDIGVCREILRGFSLYADPNDIDDMCETINRLAGMSMSEACRKNRIEYVKRNFQWSSSAENIHNKLKGLYE